MKKYILGLVGLIVVFAYVCGFAQKKVCDATWVNGITLDGKLDEADWAKLKADATLLQTVKPIPEQIDIGTADGDADISAEFVLGWDANYFYCSSWYHDDIHFDPRSKDVTGALACWQDDSHEWWIDVDYSDIVTDQIPLYYGNYGWQMMQGFNLSGGVPERLVMAYYHDEMGGAVGYGVTTDVGKEKGFDAPYTTIDGTNFECEGSFKWSSDLMNQKGTAVNEDELAFNIAVNDADAATRDAGTFTYMRWTGGDHDNIDGWGKVTLKGGSSGKITPVVSVKKENATQELRGVFDIYGKRINAVNSSNLRGIHFVVKNDAKTVKQMVVR